METRTALEQLEAGGGALEAPLAYLASGAVSFGDDELRAARRRALLVVAAGGDPRRELDPDARAVSVLAEDLDDPARRRELSAGLRALERESRGLDAVSGALASLLADEALAWRLACYALLAEELADPPDE